MDNEEEDVMPLSLAVCCIEWQVPFGFDKGRCGYCGTVPVITVPLLPESEWLVV